MSEFLPYTTQELMELFKTAYYTQTGKQMIIGSEEFAFSAVASYVLRVLEQQYNKKIEDFSIDTATGEALDTIGALYGVKRYPPSPSKVFVNVYAMPGYDVYLQPGQVTVSKNGYTFTNNVLYKISQTYQYITLYCTESGSASNGTQFNDKDIIIDPYVDLTLGFDNLDQATARGGDDGCFDSTPENDEIFRQYIKSYIGFTIGTQKAYETKALENKYLDDVYVLREGDTGFVKGYVDLYYYYQGMDGYSQPVQGELLEALTADDFKPICDTIRLHGAGETDKTLETFGFYIYYDLSYQMPDDDDPSKSVAQAHYEQTLGEYAGYLSAKLGRFPYASEILKRLCTPDAKGRRAISANITTTFTGFNPPNAYLVLTYPSWQDMVNASHIEYYSQGEV